MNKLFAHAALIFLLGTAATVHAKSIQSQTLSLSDSSHVAVR